MKRFSINKYIYIYLIIIYDINRVESIDLTKIEDGSPLLGSIDTLKTNGLKDSSEKNSIKPVEVYINTKDSNEYYDCVAEKPFKTRTYKPKKGFLFSVVKEQKGKLNCLGSDKVIWKATKAEEYANKVVFDRMMSDADTDLDYTTITIYLINGTMKHFIITKAFNLSLKDELIEVVYNIPESEHPKYLTVLTLEDQGSTDSSLSADKSSVDTLVTKVNDASKYKVNKYLKGKDVIEYTYEFDKNTVCVEVKYKDKVIWNHNDKHRYSLIDKIIFVPSKKMIVFSKDKIQFYSYTLEKGVAAK